MHPIMNIQKFTLELSTDNPERKHTSDSFMFTCNTHVVEMLHIRYIIQSQSNFSIENVLTFL